ncbi:MFS transporter [Azotosporobacter soli]|uniref:MFS transporter n=1 Tax=Azotosporobacter soli TaxID=3055040 RepID=UPI0031FF2D1C
MKKRFDFAQYRFDPLQWVILVGLMLSRIGTSMMMPFFVIFLTYELGLSFALAGFISGSSFAAYLVGGFFGGFLSDRYGRKKIFIVSLFSYAASFCLFGLAAAHLRLPGMIEPVFFAINLLAGLNRSCIDTMGQAILADLAEPEQRTALFSLRYTMANIGNAIGPLLGAALGFAGTTSGFYLTGAFCFAYFFLFLLFSWRRDIRGKIAENEEKPELREVIAVLRKDRAMGLFLLGGMTVTFVFSQMDSTLGLIILDRLGSPALFATIMAVNAITVVVLQMPVTAYFLRRFSLLTTMRIGCIFLALGLVGNAFSGQEFYRYVLSQILFTFGEILIFPISAMFVESIAPLALRGSYFGAMSFLFVGRALGPAAGGFLLQHLGAHATLFCFAVLALGATWLYLQGDRAVTQRKMAVEALNEKENDDGAENRGRCGG